MDDEPEDVTRLGSVDELARIVDEQRPDLIVLTDDESSGRAIEGLLTMRSDGFKVMGLPHFFDHAFGRCWSKA